MEACARTTPDVVILDVGLPGLSGFDVARALKSNGSKTKILVQAPQLPDEDEDE